jgi:hypothetical protein
LVFDLREIAASQLCLKGRILRYYLKNLKKLKLKNLKSCLSGSIVGVPVPQVVDLRL